MTRLVVVLALVAWVGSTLLLSELRWFARPSLVARLRPYLPGQTGSRQRGLLSAESFREVLGPLAATIGTRAARLFGVTEDVGEKLTRIHSRLDPTAFRVRQLGVVTLTLAVALVVATGTGLPVVVGLLCVLGAPVLAFLLAEHRLAAASAAWQHRLFLELAVVAEQLAMLLSAGFSLGSALNRLAERSAGAVGADLGRVCARVRQGVGEARALEEWAALAKVDVLDRLVPLLALHATTSDLGRLVSEEARAIRQEVHRSLVATMERRAQQVWVPVTVATLVPGVIFLAIPFIEALRLFAAG